MEWFTENKVAWMLLLFIGILYWAFGPRFGNRSHRPPGRDKSDDK